MSSGGFIAALLLEGAGRVLDRERSVGRVMLSYKVGLVLRRKESW